MDNSMFKKMKIKDNFKGVVLYAPAAYPKDEQANLFDHQDDQVDFVHLFVTSKAEFTNRIQEALGRLKPKGLLWISYPKSKKKGEYDINRDSLWSLSLEYGIKPVFQISLDELWSALRFVEQNS